MLYHCNASIITFETSEKQDVKIINLINKSNRLNKLPKESIQLNFKLNAQKLIRLQKKNSLHKMIFFFLNMLYENLTLKVRIILYIIYVNRKIKSR